MQLASLMETIQQNLDKKNKVRFYIQNLEIFIFLLDEKLLVELFNEVHLFTPINEMLEWFQNRTILNGKYFQRNMASTFGIYQ